MIRRMERIRISAPQRVEAGISLPASKSICNRALVINALAGKRGGLHNLSDCDDTSVMVAALHDMPYTIDIMAAGTAMRFLTSYLAVTPGEHLITGTERMCQRPIKILVEALRQLGANVDYAGEEGFPPLKINGRPLEGGKISLPGNVSSQYISSLLMIGPILQRGLQLELEGSVVSRPYINMTLQLMDGFGADARWTSENGIEVRPKAYLTKEYVIENDWSAASYWYEIVALAPQAEVVLPGLFDCSMQGDSAVARLFEQLGVSTTYVDDRVHLQKTDMCVERMEYDFVNQPDLAQTFVVTCALLNVPFRFTGLQSLKIKETDRIAALIAEMKKLGYVITESEGSILEWNGEKMAVDVPPVIDTYEDHRMAMAFAPAAFCVDGLCINHPKVVSKSYPGYWNDLREAGFVIEEE